INVGVAWILSLKTRRGVLQKIRNLYLVVIGRWPRWTSSSQGRLPCFIDARVDVGIWFAPVRSAVDRQAGPSSMVILKRGSRERLCSWQSLITPSHRETLRWKYFVHHR